MKLKQHLALLALAIAGTGAAHAAAVTVSFDNTLSGVTDNSGAPLITIAQVGWFQSNPTAIGLNVAALQADFIEVGSVQTDQLVAGAFSTAFNFDDTDSFEGTAYSGIAGQTMWGLIVSPDSQSIGLVSFSETFPVGESAIPPDTSSSAGWNPGTSTVIYGAFSGNDIGGGNPSFRLQAIPEPSVGILGLFGAALLLRRRRK